LAGSRDSVEALLSAGADVNGTNAQGDTALTLAVRASRADIVDLLLSRKANPSKHAKAADPAVVAAAKIGNPTIMRSLIAAHVQIDERDADGLGSLSVAAQ